MTIKAIETVYNGYRFRSRLEARWAVFFDTLGIRYEYEKEGFDLGEAGWYLPDFWLPAQRCWIEVKGREPEASEIKKAEQLWKRTGYPVVIFQDVPSVVDVSDLDSERAPEFSIPYRGIAVSWHECFFCGLLSVADELCPRGCSIKAGALFPSESMLWSAWRREASLLSDPQRLFDAFAAARQARFEHGETPLPPIAVDNRREDVSVSSHERQPVLTLDTSAVVRVSAAEAAVLVNRHERIIRWHIKRGDLPAYKGDRRQWQVDVDDLARVPGWSVNWDRLAMLKGRIMSPR